MSPRGAVAKALEHLVSELQLARYREQVKMEWVKLAMIVDKFCALAFVIAAFCVLSINHYHTSHQHR